ncbi:phosphoglycerate mutase family protein-like protein [Penicillium cosmopolitanum]|uniref:Phosphoglycerate mutase family protein-like protein n=1 Tax=Penicillium cosmopolitanum TaxID=1131564 RepID=A0A9W9W3F8_9EURO|nr:phosphoglycerate mutase family protein-like protein [Penicillium cosmopolitanum]KAJ5398024.1 phosphoglycerate mutase family protein-like protein [Penicillium cosmopolitanum]
MPPVLYVIRHAQGEHNDSHHLRDALLTEAGKAQCKDLQEHFLFMQDVQALIASPLRRAIQTAAFTFAPELEKRQLPIILAPDAQEISFLPCDLGHDADVIKMQAPDLIAKAVPSYNVLNLDTTLVDESWNSKKGIQAPNLNAVRSRAARLRNWIYNRPEKYLALVSHGGFLHYLMEDWTGYEEARGMTAH